VSKGFSHRRLDSGVFKAIQRAGVEAFSGPQDNIQKINEIYTGIRNVVVNVLNKLGWNLKLTKATFYIWIPTLNKMSSMEFSNLLLEKTRIIVTPGIGYGEYGEGYLIFKYPLTLFFYLTSLISQSRPNSISLTGVGIPVSTSQPINS